MSALCEVGGGAGGTVVTAGPCDVLGAGGGAVTFGPITGPGPITTPGR